MVLCGTRRVLLWLNIVLSVKAPNDYIHIPFVFITHNPQLDVTFTGLYRFWTESPCSIQDIYSALMTWEG